jgi:meso-butanediol dehydrogenase / (S,S)-butanediol dehydrogenase / diacetyl reductase
MQLNGKKALITGAASGIGRATAIKFAAEGALVTIADVNEAGLHETAALMAATPRIRTFDAADEASCRALVDFAAQDGLDVLCNISGILKWGATATFPVADFQKVLLINTVSVFVLCQAALPHLIKSGGNIVNTASTAGVQGIAYNAAYSASKHAVVGITKSLAVEVAGKGVRVNAICPGAVATPMTSTMPEDPEIDWPLVMRNAPKLPEGTCQPEDIAELFVFLASDKARKVTGSLYVMDGGQMAG